MIVDCHTHLKINDGGLVAAEYEQVCEDVQAYFLLAKLSDDCADSNEKLVEHVKNSDKTVGFAVVNPLNGSISKEALKALTLDAGLYGIVLYCSEHGFHPANSDAMNIYRAAQELGLVVFFHNSSPLTPSAIVDYAQPYLLDEVAREFPDLKIIIGRMGVPFVDQTLCMLAKHKNVYADLTIYPNKTWQVYNIVVGAYEAAIMDKLLFGSGFPIAKPDTCIETLLGFNKMLADTHLPVVPREKLRSIVERDTLGVLGIRL